jgi:hypothetical protein
MSTRESDNDHLQVLLKAQYGHVEAYCNAQTMLQNELLVDISRDDGVRSCSQIRYQHALQQATLGFVNSISEVQEDLRMLLAACNQRSDRNEQRALDAHVQRSIRVLDTIYHNGARFHSNGIPASKDNHETKTVALATLRASIAQLEKRL